MELRKRLNPRILFIGLYLLAFLAFIIYGLKPAEAAEAYDVSNKLDIPAIGLESPVTTIKVENGELPTPDTIVGSYSRAKNKTLLIGHSTTVFQNLKDVRLGDTISYNNNDYTVNKMTMATKESIDMRKLLVSEEKDTIVLMTCAGKLLGNGDATYRLIITATKN